jgi:hypothetical protein
LYQPGAPQVHRDNPVKLLLGQFVQRRKGSHAGIVHQEVKAAERSHGLSDPGRNALAGGNVTCHADRAAADLLCRGRGPLYVGDNHARSR